jgi:hypothetical protein
MHRPLATRIAPRLSAEMGLVETRCACRKLDPAILVMKSAVDRSHSDLAELLNGTKKRRVLSKSEMRSDVVIVGGLSGEDPAPR